MRQRVIATLGRLDVLQASGQLDRLLRSGLRFSEKIRVLDAHVAGKTEPVSVRKIGADLVFGRLWESMGMGEIVGELAGKSILKTRPIYDKCDETIRGHVFCSFLALCLKRELVR